MCSRAQSWLCPTADRLGLQRSLVVPVAGAGSADCGIKCGITSMMRSYITDVAQITARVWRKYARPNCCMWLAAMLHQSHPPWSWGRSGGASSPTPLLPPTLPKFHPSCRQKSHVSNHLTNFKADWVGALGANDGDVAGERVLVQHPEHPSLPAHPRPSAGGAIRRDSRPDHALSIWAEVLGIAQAKGVHPRRFAGRDIADGRSFRGADGTTYQAPRAPQSPHG
jgi:hypothetical protein